MPPKTPIKPGEVASLSQSDIDYIVVVLKEVGAMEVDWRAVAATVGINRHDNAATRFNGILKKLGCKLVKGKIIPLDEAAAAPANGQLATPTKPTKAKAKTPGTGRKRKAKEAAPNNAEADEGADAKKVKVEDKEKGPEGDEDAEEEMTDLTSSSTGLWWGEQS